MSACPWPNDEAAAPPHCRGPDGAFEPDRVARAYALDGKPSEEFPDGTKWAHSCVWSLALEKPHEALEVIRLAAAATTTDWQRNMIGCGNLESLLGNHGAEIIGDVERLAREEPAFRKCLESVWRHGMPDDVWRRVLAASGRTEA